MDWHDILAHRLHTQGLYSPTQDHPAQVVHHMGAVQAQDYYGACWGIAQRLSTTVTAAHMEELLNSGRILRTHVLRPTWHFVHPTDIRWMLALSRDRVHQVNRYYYNRAGLTDAVFAKSERVLTKALTRHKYLTRRRLQRVLHEADIMVSGNPLAYVLMHAELEGVICSGPRHGLEFTYALLEERVALAPIRTHDEALEELTHRFFSSHGPATITDMAWWSGLRKSDVARGIEAVGKKLQHEAIEGGETVYFTSPDHAATHTHAVYLLASYDEYTVGYRVRPAFFTHDYARSQQSKDSPHYSNIIVYRNQIIGVWKCIRHNKSATFSSHLYAKQAPTVMQSLEAAINRYEDHIGLPIKRVADE